MNAYADWKAPATDQAELIWPAPLQIAADARANQSQLESADSVKIQNAPLPVLRKQMRQSIGHTSAQPLIAAGHQIELYHPGVWVKNVLLDAVARVHDVRPMHIAVDTDTPKHLQLRWPGGAIDDLLLKTGEWTGQVYPPTARHLRKIEQRFNDAAKEWSFKPTIAPFFEQMDGLADTRVALPEALLRSALAVDATLGLKYEARVLSPMLVAAPFLAFAHHIAADIERFAAVYNAALADYRRENKITSPTRPMPDLKVDADVIELPFWFDNLATGDRSRAQVVRDNGRWHLLADAGEFAFDPARPAEAAADGLGEFLKLHELRLSPRALVLTSFFRLLLVDQFVHGIGGGRYDQVTDQLLQRYWGIAAPKFAVTTATMVFPDAGARSAVCVPCIKQDLHHAAHNFLPKHTYLAAITAAPRHSNERKTHYLAMHRTLQAGRAESGVINDLRTELENTIEQQKREKVLFDRELFYAIQPRDRLEAMIARYRAAV